MAKLPEIRYGNNIKYDVPYEYMDDDNDCWEAALLMLYQFDGVELDLREIESVSRARGAGIKPEDLPGFLSKFLEPHHAVPSSPLAYYQFLDKHGPALVVLNEIENILHAQVLTGIHTGAFRSTVFLNNPDQDFSTADLSASGPFFLIERSIRDRYGGLSFEDWKKTCAPDDDKESVARAAPEYLQPSTSPVPSRQGSPQASPPPSRQTSPQRSPELPRRNNNNNNNNNDLYSPGPMRPAIDWAAFRMQLERTIPGNAESRQMRQYLADMEEQYLFRKHRPMAFLDFQAKLMKEKDVAPLWTLRDW